jgi:uncharacterized membrane protein
MEVKMYLNFLTLLRYCVPAAAQVNYVTMLTVYLDASAAAMARSMAYRGMWAIIAPGVSSPAVQMAFAFGRVAMAAAGLAWDAIAGVYALIAAFMAGTGGLIALIVIIALLILLFAYFAYQWQQSRQQQLQQQQRQQNIELEKSTQKLFGTSMAPYQVVVNAAGGPVETIRTRQLPEGCKVG